MNRYADVVVPLSLDGLFTYEVPHELSVRVEPGSRVVVPFGSRRPSSSAFTTMPPRPAQR